MERVQVVNGKLKLPESIVRWVGKENELVISLRGDSVVLKKILPPRMSDFAKRKPEDTPMSMDEIVAEVKKVRRTKKRARRS